MKHLLLNKPLKIFYGYKNIYMQKSAQIISVYIDILRSKHTYVTTIKIKKWNITRLRKPSICPFLVINPSNVNTLLNSVSTNFFYLFLKFIQNKPYKIYSSGLTSFLGRWECLTSLLNIVFGAFICVV